MAAEEVEYESDPEEAKMSLKMRRRVASDDEEEVEAREKPFRRIDSDVESDAQGAAPAEYDDEEEEEVEDEVLEEYLEEEEELEERGYEEEGVRRSGEGRVLGHSQVVETVVEGERSKEWGEEKLGTEVSTEADGRGSDGVDVNGDGTNDPQQRDVEEKKENEPYAVPTAGAFYMHDDRFRENLGGRQRRTLGGRKLWESRDDRKWGHDKFEELTSRENQYEEGRRSSRGRFRGRGRSRGAGRGYSQGNRPKTYDNNNNQNNNKDQNNASKSVRGRGPRRYQPSSKNNDAPFTQNKQSGKSVEKSSRTSSGRATLPNSDVDSGAIQANRQVFASSLSSASPPFYPSGSSTKESTQKRDVQAGTVNRNIQAPVVNETFSMAQPNTMMRGKNVVDSIGLDKLYIDDATSGVAGKPSTTLQFAPSGSSSVNSSQSQHARAQGRGLNTLPGMTYQPIAASNLANRVSPPTQLHGAQRYSVQSRVQPSSRQFAQRPGSASQASSPTKAAAAVNSLESGELESPSELSKSKTALVGKGKVNVQGSGRNPFLYGGTQVMGPSGNMNTGHGDQNFPAAPTFLPVMQLGGQQVMQLGGQQVMQLGGQHPGGIGVPAVGMAFPGYVGNPQLGLGNSEMTWLPVLAGAAGALGASYCSPYIAVDGAYHARPSGQASALPAASSKENNTNKPSNEGKSSQRPEHANDDFGQRQKNPRRYTEMKFDQ